MVEIYSSWSKGLAYDKTALKMLKGAGIAGIELGQCGEEVELIQNSGLKFSLHNPSREKRLSLGSADFIQMLKKSPEIIETCNASGPPSVGFHIGNPDFLKTVYSIESLEYSVLSGLKFLDSCIAKKIIFESCPYYGSNEGKSSVYYYVTTPEFIRAIISKSTAGYLFDVAHNTVTGQNKIAMGEYNGTIEEYLSELLSVCAKETFQVHLNVPRIEGKKWVDAHAPFNARKKESRQILTFAKEVIDSCPNLKTITLEIDSNLAPQAHAKLIIAQEKIIQKLL
jgi:hypothetical protein